MKIKSATKKRLCRLMEISPHIAAQINSRGGVSRVSEETAQSLLKTESREAITQHVLESITKKRGAA